MFANLISIIARVAMAASFTGIASHVSSAELRTYEFVEGQGRRLHFGGGLLGMDVAAELQGSFDIEIEAGGTTRLTRFDVRLVNISDQGLYPASWSDGDSLAEKLFVDPVGFTGSLTDTQITLGEPHFIPQYFTDPDGVVSWGLTENGPNTFIQVNALTGNQAELRISSAPITILDNPSFNSVADLLVRIVPEPTTWILSAAAAALFGVCRRRK